MTRIQPLPMEKLLLSTKPHPMAFWHLHAISALVIFLGPLIAWIYSNLRDLQWLKFLSAIPVLNRLNLIYLLVYWAVLIGFAVIVGLVYIRFTAILLFGSIALVGTFLTEYLKQPLEAHMWLLISSGLIGFLLTELYRQGHNYYITDSRVILQKSFISNDSRQLTYSQISDISIVQGLLGRIFDFGTVIPVTVSGFGLGHDSAVAGLGTGLGLGARSPSPFTVGLGFSASGGRAVQLPRGRTYHTLYGVRHPNDVAEAIARQIMR